MQWWNLYDLASYILHVEWHIFGNVASYKVNDWGKSSVESVSDDLDNLCHFFGGQMDLIH